MLNEPLEWKYHHLHYNLRVTRVRNKLWVVLFHQISLSLPILPWN